MRFIPGKERKLLIRYYVLDYRIKAGFSQHQVADMTGTEHNAYWKFEHGQSCYCVDIRYLVSLARALNVPLKEFVLKEAEYMNKLAKLNGTKIIK